MDPALQELLAEGAPGDEVAVVLRLADGLSPPVGARIVARFGAIATCRVQRGDIPAVRAAASVLSMKAPRRYLSEAEADAIEDEETEADDLAARSTDQRRPADVAETGKGVLMAHIDWGADIAHPDFRHTDGRTRFAALWDQAAPYDPAQPHRYGYGRIHRTADIDRALQADDPYAALGYHPARGKPGGGSHGSHTLGISAGNGRAGGPVGLAPEAALVFVDLSTQQQPAGSGLGDSAALLEGLDFIADVAATLGAPGQPLPLVVNASLGRQAGQHDGKTLTEQGMDAFLLAAPGRAIVQSTGNYFGRRIHCADLLHPGGEAVLDFTVAPAHPAHEIDLWYPGSDLFGVAVQGPAGMAPVVALPDSVAPLIHGGGLVGRVYHRRSDPNNGDHEVVLYLDATAPAGAWALHLRGDDVVDGRLHAWIERGPGGGAAQAAFTAVDDSPCCTLGTICNGLRTLAVGAVDAHDAERPLAAFSSGGPTRDGRAKPDLLAPGYRVLSARSAAADGVLRPLLTRMSGTSMAAPHVSGTVALMFSAATRPLTIHETRRLLLAGTTPAAPPPDAVARWRQGAGHLDTAAAVAAARALAATAETPSETDSSPLRSIQMIPSMPVECKALEATEAGPPGGAGAQPACACGPAEVVAEEGFDESLAEALADTERRFRLRQRARLSERRGLGAAPLQFQIPIGGGTPSLALPIGGAGSPFAFSVPLGGTPAPGPVAAAPAPVPAPIPAPVVPVAATPAGTPVPTPNLPPADPSLPALAAVPAAAFDAPVLVAGNIEIPPEQAEASEAEWAFEPPAFPRTPHPGMALLAAADAACHGGPAQAQRSSSQWLRHLLAAAENPGAGRSFSLRGDGGAAPTATALFNAFVFADGHALRQRQQARFREHLQPLAGPGDHIAGLRVLPGDLLLRVALGQGHGHAAVVASPCLCRHDELPTGAWQAPGRGQPREGHYLHVVEVLPRPRGVAERWARRVADARGRLLPDTLLLRRHLAAEDSPVAAEDHLGALAEDAAADVRWLQNALNQVLGTRLAVDGDAGPATRAAVRSFQGRSGLATDGIAGPRTLAALREALQRGGAGGGATPNTASGSGTQGGGAGRIGGTGSAGDCETLSGFPQGRDTLSSMHQTQIIAVARRILRDAIRSVLITGFASSEGGDVDNFVLGMQRASRVAGELRSTLERLRPGSSSGLAVVPLSRGESEQVGGGDRPQNRRVTICVQVPVPVRPDPVTPTVTKVFRVVAKSFIGPVGSRVGTLDCELSSTASGVAGVVLGPLGGFVVDQLAPTASNVALRAMAAGTDLAFSENPTSDRIFTSPPPENKGYRLFSRGQLSARCRGSALVDLTLAGGGAIDTDAGKECLPPTSLCLQAPPLIIDQPFVKRRIDASRMAFRWGVKGRPPSAAEPAFQAICMRDSVFIWHQIDGVIDCSSGSPMVSNLVLTGSRFPSHRLWVDGMQVQTVTQGPMSRLWEGRPGDPTRVR